RILLNKNLARWQISSRNITDMFTNITRTTLCITAFSIASLMAAPLNATKTESLDWNWKFARFGKMPDGSTQPEPGKAMG
ncbi:hypothetical protein LIP81_20705, partial [Erysipelatoclostridium ramosum]|nr:hypothetical protein [Thomasclavelia ramosa]